MHTETLKLLLIDDDPDINLLVRSILKNATRYHYEITWAHSFETGLNMALAHKFDAILEDYYLGHQKTGPELVAQARAAGCKTPFIMLTTNETEDSDVETVKLGAMDYILKKNLNVDLLEKSILYAIERNKHRLKMEEDKNRYKTLNADFGDFFSSIREDLLSPLSALDTALETFIQKHPEHKDSPSIIKILKTKKELHTILSALKDMDM